MLHKLHRISAMVIGAYVLVHLLNHLMALNGITSHQAFMDGYRHVYRQMAARGIADGVPYSVDIPLQYQATFR
jgi:succinate dehydrogenase/fumarate reductase cytochrome b subunit